MIKNDCLCVSNVRQECENSFVSNVQMQLTYVIIPGGCFLKLVSFSGLKKSGKQHIIIGISRINH